MTEETAAPEGQANVSPTGDASTQTTQTTVNVPWYKAEGLNFTDEQIGTIQNNKWEESPAQVMTGYQEMVKFRGATADQLLKLPSEKATAEEKAEFYNKLGRPADVAGYGELKLPEGLSLDNVDSGRINFADKMFHELGLTKEQRNGAINGVLQQEKAQHEALIKSVQVKQEAELVQLKNEWGQAYAEREQMGKNAARTFLPGNEEAKNDLLNKMESSIGTANMLKLFSNIGEQLGEDKMPSSGDDGRQRGYTPEQAKADKATLMRTIGADRERLTLFNQNKGNDIVEMNRLNAIIAGVR